MCYLESENVIDVDYKCRQIMCIYLTVQDIFNFFLIYTLYNITQFQHISSQKHMQSTTPTIISFDCKNWKSYHGCWGTRSYF
jgi:hypothetical protein